MDEKPKRTILDIIEGNFQAVTRKTYLCRLIYIAEHSMESIEKLSAVYENNILVLNETYTAIKLTGLVLYYTSYVSVILEGSENIINRHIRCLLNNEINPNVDKIGRMKLLAVYHNVGKNLFTEFMSISAKPPTLALKLDPFAPAEEHVEVLTACIAKLDSLATMVVSYPDISFEGVSANEPKSAALPEFAILEFLLGSKHVMDLKLFNYYHRRVDDCILYFEMQWPAPTAYTPRCLYKMSIDDEFIEALPSEKNKEDDDDEGDKSGRGSSKESD